MRKATVIAVTGICWLLGALSAFASLYGIFDDDKGVGGIIFFAVLAISLLVGGRAIGRKISYCGEDLDKQDEAYLRGLEAGRKRR